MNLILNYLRAYWGLALLAPLLMLGEVAMDLMQPTLMSRIVDVGIARLDITVVSRTGLFMLLAAAAGLAGGVGCGVTASMAAAGVARDLRRDLYRKVLSFSHANVDEIDTGNIITRLTNDVTQVENMTRMLLRIMVRAPLQVVGSIIMAVIISPSLSLLVLILVPILIALFWGIIRRAYPLFSAVQERLDGVNVRVQESLSGIRLVKSFVHTDFEKERFGVANDGFMQQHVRAARVVALIHPSTQTVMYLGIAAVLWFGGVQVQSGGLPIGRVLAFLSYLTQLLFALIMTSNLLMQLSRAQASIERIREILNAVPAIDGWDERSISSVAEGRGKPSGRSAVEAADGWEPARDTRIRGAIEFRGVDFQYDTEPVLVDVSFRIEPGEIVVVMGETGSGKSTLVSLIPRLYDVTGGRVLIDGVDVREYDLDVLRAAIGMAPQEVVLFSGSIRENIVYGLPACSGEIQSSGGDAAGGDADRVAGDAEVHNVAVRAARAAAIAPFIDSLPGGYDTDVRRGGVNLSGGQKQRLSIARAVAPSPPIRIFDDATSAVDLATELDILEALASEAAKPTTVVVAQRITTAMRADRVIVLDEGRVSGVGTHDELMEGNRIYREIYQSQFGRRRTAADPTEGDR